MWLKKLVAISMIISLVGMNAIMLIGIFGPNDNSPSLSLSQPDVVAPPVVSLSANPGEVKTGLFSALKWSVTGQVDGCVASGDWSGAKTPFGSESTGRLSAEGTRTYKLVCENKSGKGEASVSLSVKNDAVAAAPSTPSPSSTQNQQQPSYCLGAAPCYGPREIATHGSSGNCWGWNGNRVINISGLDAAFHKAKSGGPSIEVSSVCGKDLASALGGGVDVGNGTRNHNSSTKSNADRNMIPYFVGYYDSAKP